MLDLKKNYQNSFFFLSLIRELSPRLLLTMILLAVCKSSLLFLDYISINLILNSIVENKLSNAIFFASISIFANVLIMMIQAILRKKRDDFSNSFCLRFEKKVSSIFMNLTYAKLESNETQKIRHEIEEIKMRLGGVEHLLKEVEDIFESVATLFSSIVMLIFVLWLGGFNSTIWSFIIILLLAFLSVIILVYMQRFINKKIISLNREVNSANSGSFIYMQLISDLEFGMDIRLYNLSQYLGDSFYNMWTSSKGLKLMKRLDYISSVIPCFVVFIKALSLFSSFVLVSVSALSGTISIGNVVIYAGSLQTFVDSISTLLSLSGDFINSCDIFSPYKELFDICQEDKQQQICCANESQLYNLEGISSFQIEFKNVYFRYPFADSWALNDVSLLIKDKEHISIVGENGSGKSTFVKLLSRIYAPTSGQIYINGIDIQNIPLVDYHKLFGVVFQDFSFLSLQIGENIAVSCEPERIKILKYLNKVELGKWFTDLPNDIYTYMNLDFDEKGIKVSGGELQRLALARAMYREPLCYILDEPTSALDPRIEEQVFRYVNSSLNSKTSIMISHRLASCKDSSRIYVFDDGKIMQIGTHRELLQNESGLYAKLWNTQAEFYQ